MSVITRIKRQGWREPKAGPCACSRLRKAARAVTSMYDGFLAASGLTVTQYALLVNVGRADGVSRTVLADRLGMERTTMTRNLRPLEREGLLGEAPGEDRREKVLRLTESGLAALDTAFPLWEKAQRSFAAKMGATEVTNLLALLDAAGAAAKR